MANPRNDLLQVARLPVLRGLRVYQRASHLSHFLPRMFELQQIRKVMTISFPARFAQCEQTFDVEEGVSDGGRCRRD